MTFTAFAVGLTYVVLGAIAATALYVIGGVVMWWFGEHFTPHVREEWEIVNPVTERGFAARFRGLSFWHSRLGGSHGIYYVRATGQVRSRKAPLAQLDEHQR